MTTDIQTIKLKDIRVYDPRADDITWEKYSKARAQVNVTNIQLAYAMYDGLSNRVLESKVAPDVAPDVTLEKWLYGDNGYFNRKESAGIGSVVFIDGKFYNTYKMNEAPDSEKLTKIAKRKNSVPFVFYRQPIVDLF